MLLLSAALNLLPLFLSESDSFLYRYCQFLLQVEIRVVCRQIQAIKTSVTVSY